LLLPAGELVRVAIGEPAEADQVQHVGGASGRARAAAQPQSELDVGECGEVREQAVRLEHHAHVAPVRGQRADVPAVDQHLPGVGVLQPGEHAQRGGPAAAGRSEQSDQLARTERQVEFVT
jgi:hypothetical protein